MPSVKTLVLSSSSDKPHALLGTLFPVGFLYGDKFILSLDSFAESQEQISCRNSVAKEEQWVGKRSLRTAHQSPSNAALSATGAVHAVGAGWLQCRLSSWGFTVWAEHPALGREGLSWLLCDEASLGPLVSGASSRFCEEAYFLPAFETGPYPFTSRPPKENSSERSLSARAGAQAGDGKGCFPLDTVFTYKAACESVQCVPVSLCPVWQLRYFHGDTEHKCFCILFWGLSRETFFPFCTPPFCPPFSGTTLMRQFGKTKSFQNGNCRGVMSSGHAPL